MTASRSGHVAVGIDGSPGSAHALRFAIEEARRRGTTLDVVNVVYWDNPGIEFIRPSEEQLVSWGQQLVAEALAGETLADDDPPVETVVVEGHPSSALLEQADGAAVLVLGTRGHGAMRSVLLGSVTLRCVLHARCPTIVVPRPSADSD